MSIKLCVQLESHNMTQNQDAWPPSMIYSIKILNSIHLILTSRYEKMVSYSKFQLSYYRLCCAQIQRQVISNVILLPNQNK